MKHEKVQKVGQILKSSRAVRKEDPEPVEKKHIMSSAAVVQ